MGLFSGGDVVIGYKYHLGMHFVTGYRVDSLLKITISDKVAWSGNVSSGNISISKPGLFGGEKKEGGVSGTITVLDGGVSQPVNTYLDSKITGNIPAFRGVFSIVLNQFYIGMSAYLKPWAFKLRRVDTTTTGEAQWNPTKSDISGDLNAIHILRECLTDSEWGMGYPTATVDDSSFTAAAATLHTEGFGLSLQWVQASPLEDFIREILNHVDAKLYVSPSTGLWTIQLIRADYVVGDLLDVNPSNVVSLESYSRIALGETVNEVSVIYRDVEDNKDKTVTVQNLGNIQMQGGPPVAQKINYPGISNADLALRVAQRDLLARSTPLAKVKIQVNRVAWDLSIGDVFKVTWPKLGLIDLVFRVGQIDTGSLTDGTIAITAIEDVFSLPSSTYAAPQPTGWTDPTSPPADVSTKMLVESPYWDIQKEVSAADIATLGADFGAIKSYAAAPSGDSFTYEVFTRIGAAAYVDTGDGDFTPTATVLTALDQDDTTVSYANEQDTDLVNLSDHAYIGTEMVQVKTLDEVAKTFTVDRGVLDTVPQNHTVGTRIWFSGDNYGVDETERTDAESVDVKLLPSTSQGTLLEASATKETIVLDSRYQRPYAPGNLKVNAVAYPTATVEDTIDVTWSHRDREQQLDSFHTQTEGNIGPEAGTTYTYTLTDSQSNVWVNETGITGTSNSFVPPVVAETFTITLKAVRDGLDSYQTHSFVFDYIDTTAYVPDEDFTMDNESYTPSPNFTF